MGSYDIMLAQSIRLQKMAVCKITTKAKEFAMKEIMK
jgi:hypothetical protein